MQIVQEQLNIQVKRFNNNNKEFIVAYSELSNLMAKEKLEKAFKLFDKDGNGTISKQEL